MNIEKELTSLASSVARSHVSVDEYNGTTRQYMLESFVNQLNWWADGQIEYINNGPKLTRAQHAGKAPMPFFQGVHMLNSEVEALRKAYAGDEISGEELVKEETKLTGYLDQLDHYEQELQPKARAIYKEVFGRDYRPRQTTRGPANGTVDKELVSATIAANAERMADRTPETAKRKTTKAA